MTTDNSFAQPIVQTEGKKKTYPREIPAKIRRCIPEFLHQTKLLIYILHLLASKVRHSLRTLGNPKVAIKFLCTFEGIIAELFEFAIGSRKALLHLALKVLRLKKLHSL